MRTEVHGGAAATELAPTQRAFAADIVGAPLKCDIATLEHPFFALRAGDHRVREYQHNVTANTLKAGPDGHPTIHDKDVLIFCISQLTEALNRKREDVNRVVQFTVHHFLVTTNRGTSGTAYRRFLDALRRLKGAVIETNIQTGGERERRGFGWIDEWRVVERSREPRMTAIEVTLSNWLFRAVLARRVLKLDADYFQLRRPFDRRIYSWCANIAGASRDGPYRWLSCTTRLAAQTRSASSRRHSGSPKPQTCYPGTR